MASRNDVDSGGKPPRGTPVPPRGGKGGANRQGRPRPAGANRSGPGRPSGANRSAGNRRAAVARQRRQRQTLLAFAAIGVAVVVVAVFIVVKVTSGPSTSAASGTPLNTPVPASLYATYTAPSVDALAAAAKGYSSGDQLVFPQETSDTAITKTGKPEVLFMGAEYCPYCATERWALVLALSKFGTFTGLTEIHSSSTDVYPDTPTWSFYKSTYTSPYLTFVPVEEYTVDDKPLQTPTAAENAIADKYDSAGTIPFVYFNGKAIISSAEYDPQLLHGLTFEEAVASIAGGTSKLADNVYADAGAIVSEICRMTGGKPSSVCASFPKPITTPA